MGTFRKLSRALFRLNSDARTSTSEFQYFAEIFTLNNVGIEKVWFESFETWALKPMVISFWKASFVGPRNPWYANGNALRALSKGKDPRLENVKEWRTHTFGDLLDLLVSFPPCDDRFRTWPGRPALNFILSIGRKGFFPLNYLDGQRFHWNKFRHSRRRRAKKQNWGKNSHYFPSSKANGWNNVI